MSIHEAAETFFIAQSNFGDKLRGKSASMVIVRGKDSMLPKAVKRSVRKTFKHMFILFV